MGKPHKRPRYHPWVCVMGDTLWVLPHTTPVRQDATKLKGILAFFFLFFLGHDHEMARTVVLFPQGRLN